MRCARSPNSAYDRCMAMPPGCARTWAIQWRYNTFGTSKTCVCGEPFTRSHTLRHRCLARLIPDIDSESVVPVDCWRHFESDISSCESSYASWASSLSVRRDTATRVEKRLAAAYTSHYTLLDSLLNHHRFDTFSVVAARLAASLLLVWLEDSSN